jgi:MFS family permease
MSNTRKAPGFLAARISLYAVGAASAAFGVAGWMGDHLDPASCILMGFTALSAFVGPFAVEIIGRSWWSVLLLPVVLVFGGINAYSFHHGVDALIEQPRRDMFEAKTVAPLRASKVTADAAVAAHIAPVFPETMGPKNVTVRMQAWSLAHAPLVAAATKAQDDLNKAVYAPLVDDKLVWRISLTIDISLALGLAGIALVRGSLLARHRKEQAVAKAVRRKAKKKRPVRAPKVRTAQDLPPLHFGKPKLVVSNP